MLFGLGSWAVVWLYREQGYTPEDQGCRCSWGNKRWALTLPLSHNRHLGQPLVRSLPSWSSSCGWGWASKPRLVPPSSLWTCCLSPLWGCRTACTGMVRMGVGPVRPGWGLGKALQWSPEQTCPFCPPPQTSATSSSGLTCTRPEVCWQQMIVGSRIPLFESSSLPSARRHG